MKYCFEKKNNNKKNNNKKTTTTTTKNKKQQQKKKQILNKIQKRETKMKLYNLSRFFMVLVFYSCETIVRGINNLQQYAQLRTVRVDNGEPTATSQGSLLKCAALCTQHNDCWMAQWHSNNNLCEMFDYRSTITLIYPLDPETSTTSVLFGKPISGKGFWRF